MKEKETRSGTPMLPNSTSPTCNPKPKDSGLAPPSFRVALTLASRRFASRLAASARLQACFAVACP
jgi:hypothetical protein